MWDLKGPKQCVTTSLCCLQTVATTRQQIGDYNAQVVDKVNQLRDDTVGKIQMYEDKYLPKVNKYDGM